MPTLIEKEQKNREVVDYEHKATVNKRTLNVRPSFQVKFLAYCSNKCIACESINRVDNSAFTP